VSLADVIRGSLLQGEFILAFSVSSVSSSEETEEAEEAPTFGRGSSLNPVLTWTWSLSSEMPQ
jgi:hypothetical protein